jgi:hypothetical protein
LIRIELGSDGSDVRLSIDLDDFVPRTKRFKDLDRSADIFRGKSTFGFIPKSVELVEEVVHLHHATVSISVGHADVDNLDSELVRPVAHPQHIAPHSRFALSSSSAPNQWVHPDRSAHLLELMPERWILFDIRIVSLGKGDKRCSERLELGFKVGDLLCGNGIG